MYITMTIKEKPPEQLSFEDLFTMMLNRMPFPATEPVKRNPYTRTWWRDVLPERILAGFDVEKHIAILRDFNARYQALRETPIESHYNKFFIPKKTGGLREINAPDDGLANCLRELKLIFEKDFYASHHACAYAYVPGRCTRNAVEAHQFNKSKWFLKTDLSGFFPNTSPEFVMNMLSQIYPFALITAREDGKRELETALSLAFLDGGLPMGTPFSPMITNLIMIPFDYEMSKWLRSLKEADKNADHRGRRFVYTRYSDDIHISCAIDFQYRFIIQKMQELFAHFNAPYTIKDEKTHYGSSGGRNWILGVMLNKDNQITIGYKKRERFKAMLFNYMKDRQAGTPWMLDQVQHLMGLVSYYRMVNNEDVDKIFKIYNEKFGVDIEKLIKEDLA